jgi:hypothetical protein
MVAAWQPDFEEFPKMEVKPTGGEDDVFWMRSLQTNTSEKG